MKCLHCGYCCMNYLVVIVDDPAKGPKETNLKVHEGKGPCQHLRGSRAGEYSCAIHDKPWYKKTPCWQHGQIEKSPTDECRMGKYILGKSK